MMPNLDPRQLKRVMDSMGIKSSEIGALRVVIEGEEKDIVIENPQVMRIDARGSISFQIQGDVREVDKVKVEISEEDIKMVMERGNVDSEKAKAALEEANGDIASALINLKSDAVDG